MKVELRFNAKGGFDCYQGDDYITTLNGGMLFTVICNETNREKMGRIGFAWDCGYFWISEINRKEKKILSDGMVGILSN